MATKPFWEESSDDEAPEPPKKRRKRGLLDDSSSDDEKQTGAARGRSPSNAIDIDDDEDETGAARGRCSSNAVELDDDEDDAGGAQRASRAARSFAESHRTKKFLRAHAPRDARVVVVDDGEALRGDVGAHDAVAARRGGLRQGDGPRQVDGRDARRRRPPRQRRHGELPRRRLGKTGQLAWVRDFPGRRGRAPPAGVRRDPRGLRRILLSKDPAAGDAWAARLLGEFDVDPGDDARASRPPCALEFARAPSPAATRGVDALSPGEAIGAKRLKAVVAARMAGAFDAADPTHCYSPFHGASPATEAPGSRPTTATSRSCTGRAAATPRGSGAPTRRRAAASSASPRSARRAPREPAAPFAVLGADGEPRGAGTFEALSPDDAWLPRRERGGPADAAPARAPFR
ncbi:hypothetical protein SO694_00077138 [Aureococcus anophagefferens]|uniref:Uncharacterized protein n=1 Tax=Aureococcus anophagefferens TaxID=44056 RepID=A0ABR1FHN3_AURAN